MTEESLRSIHPIMHANGVNILWHAVAGKVNRRGQVQTRYVVVTSAAIFITIKRSFPSGFKVSRVIPLCDIISITLTSEYLVFDTGSLTTISNTDVLFLASKIVPMMRAIFGTVNLIASSQIKMKLADAEIEYKTLNPIMDRFVSYTVSVANSNNIDKINEICGTVLNDKEAITFTPAISGTSLMPALVKTLRGDTIYKTMVLRNINYMTFQPNLKQILTTSTSIENLVFSKTQFLDSNLFADSEFYGSEKFTGLKVICFKNCNLTNPKFRDFFYTFSKMKTQINSFHLENCQFTQQTLEAIFYSMYDYQCFRSLTSITITDNALAESVKFGIIQLMNCDWVLKNKQLHKLHIMNTNIEIGSLLESLMLFESGLSDMSLSGCNFLVPVPKIKSFSTLTNIDISGCKTNAESLVSLFQCIKSATHNIQTIDLSALVMPNQEIGKFYEAISSIQIYGVSTLIWDRNPVNCQTADYFIKFIKNMPDLRDLSVSDVFTASPEMMTKLVGLVKTTALERLVIQGTGSFVFQKEMVELLKAVQERKTIVSLDITGHVIGDDGLEVIISLVPSLVGIAFGNTQAISAEVLLACLKAIEESKVEYSQWPVADVKWAITKVPLGARDRMIRAFSDEKKKFEQRFNLHIAEMEIPSFDKEPAVRMRRISTLPLLSRMNSDPMMVPHSTTADLEEVSRREFEVSSLMKSVLGPKALTPEMDPLAAVYSHIMEISSAVA